jgi:hypothetical protein
MSHQLTLWKKSFLMQELTYGEDPWLHERESTKRLKKKKCRLGQWDYIENSHHPPHGILPEGAHCPIYHTVSDRGLMNAFTPQFIPLLKEDQELAVYTQEVERHYLEKIPHVKKLVRTPWYQRVLSKLKTS